VTKVKGTETAVSSEGSQVEQNVVPPVAMTNETMSEMFILQTKSSSGKLRAHLAKSSDAVQVF
jgi:hypothetical protein